MTALNADCIMPGCICGSSSKSLTVAMVEPSGWPASTWCSIMGLGVVKVGLLASVVVLFVGPLPRAIGFWLWTLLCVWMQFHNSDGSIASTYHVQHV